MGRSSKGSGSLESQEPLFSAAEAPARIVVPEAKHRGLHHPLWTENKALLIQEYMKLFTMVTKHGTYIDGFAAPQRRDRADLCSAELVLRTEPKWIKKLWVTAHVRWLAC